MAPLPAVEVGTEASVGVGVGTVRVADGLVAAVAFVVEAAAIGEVVALLAFVGSGDAMTNGVAEDPPAVGLLLPAPLAGAGLIETPQPEAVSARATRRMTDNTRGR